MTMQSIQKDHKIISLFKLVRLNKPTGVVVLWWPTAWALWLVTQGNQANLWALFLLGSFLMRSAGCIWNDISDADIDPHVERTASRPIAAGQVSITEALVLFFVLLSFAACIAWQLPKKAFQLCFIAVGLTILYPLTKRFFKAPQLFLGFAFAMSVPIAFATQHQLFTTECLWLYLAAVLWPLVYDTIYALSDKKDDIFLNIHSLPLSLGQYTNLFVDGCQCLFVIALIIVGVQTDANKYFFLFLSLYALAATIQQIKLRSTTKYQKLFCAYQWLGGIIMLGFIFGIPS